MRSAPGGGGEASSEIAAHPSPALRADPPRRGEGELTLTICGESLLPHLSGALWWAGEATLIVADLHFEKGSAHAARGFMLPPYDTAVTLGLLEQLLARFPARRVISLGDSFHDRRAGERLGGADAARIARLQEGREWIWIAGNHDPAPPNGVRGAWHEELSIGPLLFRHHPRVRAPEGEIAGHLHPVAKLAARGRAIRRRCFATDGRRAVLPAFGSFTGGLNVLDEAWKGLFDGRGFEAWMLGARTVYQVPARRLLP